MKKYHIQNGMSYLAISSKIGNEMITKIQHQTALWQSVVSLFQPKIIKPTDRLWKSMNSVWTLKAIDQKSRDELKIICVYMASGCASAANCHPFLSWVLFFFPGCMKASMFQHNGRVVVHVKDGKYVSPKKYVDFKRQRWNFIVDSSPEDRCFQLFSKETLKKKVIIF